MNPFLNKIDLTGIKGVLIDLDNTLFDTERYYFYALKCCYQHFKKTIGQLSFREFKQRYKEAQLILKNNTANQAASHSRFIYFQLFFEKYFGKTCVDLTFQYEKIYYQSVLAKARLHPKALSFLSFLKSKKIKVCVITDQTARLQFSKINYYKLNKYINFVVSSEEAGVEKPHPRIFKLALQKIGFTKSEVVVIGDSLGRDIKGAKDFGIKRTYLVRLFK